MRALALVPTLLAAAACASAAPAADPVPPSDATPATASPTIDSVPPGARVRFDAAAAAAVRDSMHAVLARARADSAFPGAYAAVGDADGVIAEATVGTLDWAPSPAPDARTVWDLASLTKVVALTSAAMRLVDDGRLDLDAPVQRYLPEWTGRHQDRVRVRDLLTHSAGLSAWRPLYKEAASPAAARALALATPLDTVPGARYVYSDLGAITLAAIVERVTGEPLDRFVAREILAPLGMTDTRYLPPPDWRDRIAPTEFDPWRGRHLRGEVHDENAHALGGVSGHAGLFGTGHDLARFARMYLNGGELDGARVFRPETVARFTARQDSALSHRALGWETPTGRNSAGTRMSARAFGHTGFTGTSIWMDRDAGVWVLLLTNRVNPSRESRGIGPARTALADAALAALGIAAPDSAATPP